MACGTPVVCSNTSSLPEVVGDAALTVAPTDVEGLAESLGRALTDTELRATLTKRGRAQAAKFTWESAAHSLLESFQKATAHRPRREY
jgi:glycosyltransferase involved in cell wall biosynthesis